MVLLFGSQSLEDGPGTLAGHGFGGIVIKMITAALHFHGTIEDFQLFMLVCIWIVHFIHGLLKNLADIQDVIIINFRQRINGVFPLQVVTHANQGSLVTGFILGKGGEKVSFQNRWCFLGPPLKKSHAFFFESNGILKDLHTEFHFCVHIVLPMGSMVATDCC